MASSSHPSSVEENPKLGIDTARGSSSETALIADLDSSIVRIAADPTLLDELHFPRRAAALDRLEFGILDRITEGLATRNVEVTGPASETEAGRTLQGLLSRAEALHAHLTAVDRGLFERLRGEIRSGLRGDALRTTLSRYAGATATQGSRQGYDDLDDLVAGLLLPPPVPLASRVLDPEMVFYQPTPARVILDMAERIGPAAGRTLYDIGSGLGLVPILVHLISGARAVGIEIDPAYHAYAKEQARDLGIGAEVDFHEADARVGLYGEADFVFLYTPFHGTMLSDVLGRLRDQCREDVRIFSYGPCTATLAGQPWLEAAGPAGSPDLLEMFQRSQSPVT